MSSSNYHFPSTVKVKKISLFPRPTFVIVANFQLRFRICALPADESGALLITCLFPADNRYFLEYWTQITRECSRLYLYFTILRLWGNSAQLMMLTKFFANNISAKYTLRLKIIHFKKWNVQILQHREWLNVVSQSHKITKTTPEPVSNAENLAIRN